MWRTRRSNIDRAHLIALNHGVRGYWASELLLFVFGLVEQANLYRLALPSAIETVNRVFEEACRYIDGHSHPFPTLGVSPTLAGLETHGAALAATRSTSQSADS